MDIHLIASLTTADEFRSAYKKSDRDTLDNGTSLLYQALRNTSIPDRYEIARFLLDEGCVIGGPGPRGATSLHVLFGHVKHDIGEDTELAKRLISAGADINALDQRRRLPFLEVLNMKYEDDDLQPIYNIWFERSDADFTTESVHGLSPLSAAAKVPYRAKVLTMMEDHVARHP